MLLSSSLTGGFVEDEHRLDKFIKFVLLIVMYDLLCFVFPTVLCVSLIAVVHLIVGS